MITQLKEDDFLRIQEIKKSFPQLLVDFPILKKNHNFTSIYILTIKDKIVGYIAIDIIYERMELLQIEVKSSERGKGYGNKLIEFMLNEAEQKKLENITLEVRMNNIEAIYLYRKYGFQQVAIRKNYYHGIDGILMERKMM